MIRLIYIIAVKPLPIIVLAIKALENLRRIYVFDNIYANKEETNKLRKKENM